MTSFVHADDAVVAAAWAVLQGAASEGTQNIRHTTEDGDAFVYRIDPDSDASVDPDDVRSDGEFPQADAAMWWASEEQVEREVERRGLADNGPPVADAEAESSDERGENR